MPNRPEAAFLIIGDEILSGRTQDVNVVALATALGARGIGLGEVRMVPDDHATIGAAVNDLRARFAHVFTSGGIGPTHDDITADAIAAAFGVYIDVREDARSLLSAYYASRDIEMNEARLRMARIPDGAALIDNPVSIAPGFTLGNVSVCAGVPKVFTAMIANVIPTLEEGTEIVSRSVRLEVPEGDIATNLKDLAERYPSVAIGSYPFGLGGKMGCEIVFRTLDPDAAEAALAELEALTS